jgi:hypothetical protein
MGFIGNDGIDILSKEKTVPSWKTKEKTVPSWNIKSQRKAQLTKLLKQGRLVPMVDGELVRPQPPFFFATVSFDPLAELPAPKNQFTHTRRKKEGKPGPGIGVLVLRSGLRSR